METLPNDHIHGSGCKKTWVRRGRWEIIGRDDGKNSENKVIDRRDALSKAPDDKVASTCLEIQSRVQGERSRVLVALRGGMDQPSAGG